MQEAGVILTYTLFSHLGAKEWFWKIRWKRAFMKYISPYGKTEYLNSHKADHFHRVYISAYSATCQAFWETLVRNKSSGDLSRMLLLNNQNFGFNTNRLKSWPCLLFWGHFVNATPYLYRLGEHPRSFSFLQFSGIVNILPFSQVKEKLR